MIMNLLLNGVYYLVYILVSPIFLLPPVTAESNFTNAITSLSAYLANFNEIIPITTIFAVLLLVLGIEVGIMVYKIIMWAIRRIPTQS